jgi:hypothetical protein
MKIAAPAAGRARGRHHALAPDRAARGTPPRPHRHFATWVPNFGIQACVRRTPATDAVFPHAYFFEYGDLRR